LFLHYRQNIDGNTTKEQKYFEKQSSNTQQQQSQSSIVEIATDIIGRLLEMPLPMSDYDANEAALKQQTMMKKKKRRGMR
jgi:hypothetical protein